jgi:hypothetical protein
MVLLNKAWSSNNLPSKAERLVDVAIRELTVLASNICSFEETIQHRDCWEQLQCPGKNKNKS